MLKKCDRFDHGLVELLRQRDRPVANRDGLLEFEIEPDHVLAEPQHIELQPRQFQFDRDPFGTRKRLARAVDLAKQA